MFDRDDMARGDDQDQDGFNDRNDDLHDKGTDENDNRSKDNGDDLTGEPNDEDGDDYDEDSDLDRDENGNDDAADRKDNGNDLYGNNYYDEGKTEWRRKGGEKKRNKNEGDKSNSVKDPMGSQDPTKSGTYHSNSSLGCVCVGTIICLLVNTL